MFSSILIANRGEIAVRIIRTAKRMGLRTIAVYSDVDARALHVALADEAVPIGGSAAAESYLKSEAILNAAAMTGAEAIHPGYGFLSENAEFAEACEAAGLVFIGPPASAIRAMGLKDAAKARMEKAGVPVVPGYHGKSQDEALLGREAKKIGYPVLIKAVAGGGGKGMRRVDDAADFGAALASARREAAAAFGDDRVLIEKFVNQPRHIEIQIFADAHGEAVHLFERDCSLQRRHQKVAEEAPAPGMPAAMRAAMGAAAVAAAKAIGYRGAGTIEFIADASDGLRDDRFYFMEMNTRLQVEHPVTEMITGQDLVEWQIRVAAGEALPKTQEELAIEGHAIEVRLYAEDPANQFFPSPGRLRHLRFPEESAHVRVDAGIAEGDEVSMFYDPMIAKLIVWDATRDGALRRLGRALRETAVVGPRSNVAFLAEIAAHPAFCAGDIDTAFIDRHLDRLVPRAGPPPARILALAGLSRLLRRPAENAARAAGSQDLYSPWALSDGWELGGFRPEWIVLISGGERLTVTARADVDNCWRISADGKEFLLSGDMTDGRLVARIDGAPVTASVIELAGGFVLAHDGAVYEFDVPDPLAIEMAEEAGAHGAVAPMPGKVVQVAVKPGDRVRKGAALIVLEAMKMEQTLAAGADGVVAAVNVKEGDQVDGGAILVSFEAAEA